MYINEVLQRHAWAYLTLEGGRFVEVRRPQEEGEEYQMCFFLFQENGLTFLRENGVLMIPTLDDIIPKLRYSNQWAPFAPHSFYPTWRY